MVATFRSWWQQIKQHPFIVAGIIVVIFVFTAFAIAVIKYGWDWTGFNGGYGKITIHTPAKDIELPPARTLWDLLQLLFVPALLTLGAVWFTSKQTHDLKIATDNQRETRLQAYINSMSELMLHEKLRDSKSEDEVRNIAHARTLRVLHSLDEDRKRTVIQFLHQSHLINKDDPIINLDGANLLKANLKEAKLMEADLSGAKLMGADLIEAKLMGANLKGATGITIEELEQQAKSLKGATMPDGTIHP